MYSIIITAACSTTSTTATPPSVVRKTGKNDWKVQKLVRALVCADVALCAEGERGSPTEAGVLRLRCDKASQKWINKLADILEDSRISYDTEAGLGLLVEKLLAHKADWRLMQEKD